MTFLTSLARPCLLALGFLLLGLSQALGDYHTAEDAEDNVVLYFASGWPIALAEAACGGDESCLTELANCPPGPTQSCSAQAALCEVTTAVGAFPCTVRLQGGALVMRFPDATPEATIVTWDPPTRGAVAALNGTYLQQGPSCLSGADGFGTCFTLLIDPAVLTQWAGGTPPTN